jgi:hypothetical protein
VRHLNDGFLEALRESDHDGTPRTILLKELVAIERARLKVVGHPVVPRSAESKPSVSWAIDPLDSVGHERAPDFGM